MKEFEGKATWRVSEWGEEAPDCVVVNPPMNQLAFTVCHENGPMAADAPDDLKAYVRREVLRCRPTAENEWRDTRCSTSIWSFRIRNGKLEWTNAEGGNGGWIRAHLDDSLFADLVAAARAWRDRQWQDVEGAEGWQVRKKDECIYLRDSTMYAFDKHWSLNRSFFISDRCAVSYPHVGATVLPEPVIDACCKLLGVERDEPLKGNQVRTPEGTVFTLAWTDGRPKCKIEGETGWSRWDIGDQTDWCRAGDAWFRANCPPDRFVTDDGRVLEFRMRDDGEAETVRDGKCWYRTGSPGDAPTGHGAFSALYAFRDAERAKWKFIPHENGCIDVQSPDGSWCGVGVDGALYKPALMPAWVRRKAEAMWRERQAPTFNCRCVVKPKKLAFESNNWAINDHGDLVIDAPTDEDMRPFKSKNLRVTIEAVESEGM